MRAGARLALAALVVAVLSLGFQAAGSELSIYYDQQDAGGGSDGMSVESLIPMEASGFPAALRSRLRAKNPDLRDLAAYDVHVLVYPHLAGGEGYDFSAQPRDAGPLCDLRRDRLDHLVLCLQQRVEGLEGETRDSTALLLRQLDAYNQALPRERRIDPVRVRGISLSGDGWGAELARWVNNPDYDRDLASCPAGSAGASCRERAQTACRIAERCGSDEPCASAARGVCAASTQLYKKADLYTRAAVFRSKVWEKFELPSELRVETGAPARRAPRGDGSIAPPQPEPSVSPSPAPSGQPGEERPGNGGLYGSALRQPSFAAGDPFGACHWADFSRPIGLSPDCAVEAARGSSLELFSGTIRRNFYVVSVYSYLELLRMEALSTSLESYSLLTGKRVDRAVFERHGCIAPFREDIGKYLATPPPSKKTDDPAYRGELRAAALRVRARLEAVQRLQDGIRRRGGGGCGNLGGRQRCATRMRLYSRDRVLSRFGECRLYATYDEPLSPDEVVAFIGSGSEAVRAWGGCAIESRQLAEDTVSLLRGEILEDLVKYPHLAAGHDPTNAIEDGQVPIAESFPQVVSLAAAGDASSLTRAIASADAAVEQEQKRALEDLLARLCSSNGDDWQFLVSQDGLTQSVLKRYPQLGVFQDCAQSVLRTWNQAPTPGKLIKAVAMAGCVVGTMGPQGAYVGPACAAYFIGDAYYDLRESRTELRAKWTCLAARVNDESICSSKDYQQAEAEYETAVGGLVLNAVFAGLELGPLLGKVGGYLSKAELREAAALLRSARTEAEADAALRRIASLARKHGYAEAQVLQVLADARAVSGSALAREWQAAGIQGNLSSTLDALASGNAEARATASQALGRFEARMGERGAARPADLVSRIREMPEGEALASRYLELRVKPGLVTRYGDGAAALRHPDDILALKEFDEELDVLRRTHPERAERLEKEASQALRHPSCPL